MLDDERVPNSGKWFMIDAINGARRLVMRLRTDRPTEPDIHSYSTAITIRWTYPEQEGTAEPPPAMYQQMLHFEQALDELSAGNGHCFLMCVSTGLGCREWCYYAKSRERFMDRLNRLLAGHPKYQLDIQFYDDPEWKVWRDLRHGYERAGGEPAMIPTPPARPMRSTSVGSRLRKWFGGRDAN